MLFFLFIYPEILVTAEKLDELQAKQEEVKEGITGEKDPVKNNRQQTVKPNAKTTPSPSQYNGAKICIAQGGLPPSNDTAAANMREIHDANKQPDRPLLVACGHNDVFAQPADRLPEPMQR